MYKTMYAQPDAWFDDGMAERDAIVRKYRKGNWSNTKVLEIGCGKGQLVGMLADAGAWVVGVEPVKEAYTEARTAYPDARLYELRWEDMPAEEYDVVVMQGVMEHFDDWRDSLKRIAIKFSPARIITSVPCFVNVRGIVWMSLNAIGAVMSKTDLHYIHPWEVTSLCREQKWSVSARSTDRDWGSGKKMLADFKRRLPLALAGIEHDKNKLEDLMLYLEGLGWGSWGEGAIAVYDIWL